MRYSFWQYAMVVFAMAIIALEPPRAEKVLTPDMTLAQINAALNAAVAGDEFVMEAGVYPGGVDIRNRAGTEAAPIILRARTPGTVIIRGSTALRKDTASWYRSGRWHVSGITFENAARAGIYLGESSFCTFENGTSRNNGVQGFLAGGSSNGTVRKFLFLNNTEQHGAYVSGKVTGWLFENCTSAFNGRGGFQFNSQGTGGVLTKATVRNCSINNNGRLMQAAAINCLGVTDSIFEGNTVHDNWAGGIAFMTNGQSTGQSTGNIVRNNAITFRAGEGRACVQFSGGGTNTVTNNRLWTGRAWMQPISALSPSIVIVSGNTILPTATEPVEVPTEPVETPPVEEAVPLR